VKDEVAFLAKLYEELVEAFGPDLGVALLGAAASEFFAGPSGVTAMYERRRATGKPIPVKQMTK
jgi:hypothetical protein